MLELIFRVDWGLFMHEEKENHLEQEVFSNDQNRPATPVGPGRTGAVFELTSSFRQEHRGQRPLKPQESNGGRMDRLLDRPTKHGVESRSTRLNIKIFIFYIME